MMEGDILIVDDDADMVEILSTILQAEGLKTEAARNGEEAVARMRSFKPHVVITDIMMPGMDGWNLCRRIRGVSEWKGVRILALTARGRQIDELMSYESGADEYLGKPFDNRDFIAAVRRLLQKKSP